MSRHCISLRIVFLLLIILLGSLSAVAQNTYVPSQPDNLLTPADPIGIPPHASSTGTHEAINLTNGSLSVFLPALSLPQRGNWDLTLGYSHNSMTWAMEQDVTVAASCTIDSTSDQRICGDSYTYTNSMLGTVPPLQTNLPQLQASIEYVGDQMVYDYATGSVLQTQYPVFCVMNWAFTDWSGNKHPFTNVARCNSETCPPAGWSPYRCQALTANIKNTTDSTDGSWLYLDTTNKTDIRVTTKDGTVYHFNDFVDPYPNAPSGTLYSVSQNREVYYQGVFSSMVDTNGNTVSVIVTQKGTAPQGSSYSLTDTVGRKISVTPSGISYTDSNGKAQTISLNTTTSATKQNYNFPAFGGKCYYNGNYAYPAPWNNPVVTTSASSMSLAPFTIDLAFPPSDSTGTSRAYHMQFDGLAHLLQITYPAGGYTRYDYSDYQGTQDMGQVTCGLDLIQVAHKYESPSGSGAKEFVTTYAAGTPPYGTSTGLNGFPANATIDETDATGAHTHHVFATASYSQLVPRETDTYVYNASGTLLRTVHYDYSTNATTNYGSQLGNASLLLPSAVTTTLNDVSPALSTVEKRQYQVFATIANCCTVYIDNPIEIDQYDYDGTLKKQIAQTWAPASNFTPAHILDRLATRTITDPISGVQSTLSFAYNSAGDITSKTVGGTGVTSLTTNYQRDPYGNVTQVTDPKQNVTKFGYTDTWNDSTCAPASNSSAYLTSITDALNHVTNFSYNSCTGTKASATDPNGAKTSFTYDALGRPVQTNLPDGGQSSVSFVDAIPNSATTTTLISSSLSRVSKTILDGFGRAIQSQLTSDPDGVTFVDTTYDSLGRTATTSNPYRSTSDSTYGITTTNYDALGRVTQVIPPDGSSTSNNVTTTYSGNCTTVTDQAGKARKSCTDGLGRLTQVFEDPAGLNYETDYSYDALGNLLTVNQKGGSSSSVNWRTRNFTYDSLSRLTSAVNPESGTVSYTYDNDGNLATKTSWAQNQTQSAQKAATGSVTISGSEQCASGTCDKGTVSITVNGFTVSVSYGSGTNGGTSLSSIASALASGLNSSSSPVTAIPFSSGTVNLTSKITGPASNYSLSATSYSGSPLNLPDPSFVASPSGSTLTGGSNPPTTTTTFTYDALNRLTQKTYSDGVTPTAAYHYDMSMPWGSPYGGSYVGRLSQEDAIDASGHYVASHIFVYDVMGRIQETGQCTVVNCSTGLPLFHTIYSHNLLGNLTSYYTAENGTTFGYQYDSTGRASVVTNSSVDPQHPATLATVDSTLGYFPSGALRKITYGNGLTETAAFNNRLQPCRHNVNSSNTSLSTCADSIPSGNVQDFNYGFSTANNGNVASWSATGNQSFTRTFGYDSLNRLSTFADSASAQPCKGLSWTYDAWGNRTDQTVTAGTCNTFHAGAAANNCLIAPYQYDAAGNMIYDGTHSYTYDAENRLIKVDGGSTATYAYDAEGNRVQKTVGSTITVYVFNPDGQVIHETDANLNFNVHYIYLGSQLLAEMKNSTTYFLQNDHLGSARLLTAINQSVYDSLDYLPFGEQIAGSSGTSHKFTGKERDAESGLDYFGARYYGSSMGRFMSPDPMLIMRQKMTDPQQWNMYSYVRNNPLTMVDMNGKWPTDIHNQIIDRAFPGLSVRQRDILKSSSAGMDHCIQCQMESTSFQHSMRAPDQSPAEAKQQAADFVHTEEHLAQDMQATNGRNTNGNPMPSSVSDIKDNSLSMFGNAAHTVADGTSPAHVDAQGNPLPWNPYSLSGVEAHEAAESTISPDQMNSAVTAVRQAFQDTYGQTAAQQAATPPPPPQQKQPQ
jgi:RHS repeat-associated protein